MKLYDFAISLLLSSPPVLASLVKRDAQFVQGEPISADGKGAPILGELDGAYQPVQLETVPSCVKGCLAEKPIRMPMPEAYTLLTLLGGTNKQLDLQNPDNLAQQPTDNGVVPNLKWSFSDSKVRIFNGGWVREQVIQDLPQSHDIAAAQQHLKKGALRELHWHRVVSLRGLLSDLISNNYQAEWGFVYNGSILVS